MEATTYATTPLTNPWTATDPGPEVPPPIREPRPGEPPTPLIREPEVPTPILPDPLPPQPMEPQPQPMPMPQPLDTEAGSWIGA